MIIDIITGNSIKQAIIANKNPIIYKNNKTILKIRWFFFSPGYAVKGKNLLKKTYVAAR
jgi:hypothetical protein